MTDSSKVAVVTGAAQGIGRRTAEVLAERGFALALNDLRQPHDTPRAVHVRGAEVLEFVGDISDETVVQRSSGVCWRLIFSRAIPPGQSL